MSTRPPCPDCDGDGYYTPQFSPRVITNCQTCNRDGLRTPKPRVGRRRPTTGAAAAVPA